MVVVVVVVRRKEDCGQNSSVFCAFPWSEAKRGVDDIYDIGPKR
jgi:hypothetical protein